MNELCQTIKAKSRFIYEYMLLNISMVVKEGTKRKHLWEGDNGHAKIHHF